MKISPGIPIAGATLVVAHLRSEPDTKTRRVYIQHPAPYAGYSSRP